uniref:Dedicator of cytokinesis TPR repeats region domain-containing protein n=1 Tax=Megaselia scalaris TaxID=36166 RepID=T1GB51_MEGSC
MASNNVIRKSLEEFSNPLVYKFLQHDRFDMELWCEYFKVVVCFVTQSTLQIEKYPELKKRQVLQNYGDMRVTMGFQVLSMWSQLGDKKCNFIPFMIGPILEITLVPETSLRKSTIEVFYDMIQCEQHESERDGKVDLVEKQNHKISQNI